MYKHLRRYYYLYTSVLVTLVSSQIHAIDVVYLSAGESTSDHRRAYKIELLQTSLELTKPKYGDFEISIDNFYMNGERSFKQLANGESMNVFFALARSGLDDDVVAIPIPVRRGLVSYRLLMIKAGTEKRFENINSLDDLKKLRVGADTSWATYQTLLTYEFNIVKIPDYEGMFPMLQAGRFDYIPRTVNEIYPEIDRFTHSKLHLAIEPTLALYIPSATYVYVNKGYPRLKERLQEGLELMLKNGDLMRLFSKYYGQRINAANLGNRRIITMGNTAMPEDANWEKSPLWFSPTFKQTKTITSPKSTITPANKDNNLLYTPN